MDKLYHTWQHNRYHIATKFKSQNVQNFIFSQFLSCLLRNGRLQTRQPRIGRQRAMRAKDWWNIFANVHFKKLHCWVMISLHLSSLGKYLLTLISSSATATWTIGTDINFQFSKSYMYMDNRTNKTQSAQDLRFLERLQLENTACSQLLTQDAKH